MKWVALMLIVFAAPAIAAWLRTNPRLAPLIWGLLGFLPFVLSPWHLMVAPFATPLWSGYVKGWEVSLLDAVALGVIIGSRGGRWPRLTLLLPFIFYVLVVTLAVTQAKFGTLAWSYVLQLLRVGMVYAAVARVVESDKGERAVLTGLIAGLVVQLGYASWAWLQGALQTGGSVGHQNLLGFISHMVVMPALAMFLAGRWQRVGLLGVGAGLIVVILTASRATIGFSALGLLLTLLISMASHMSGRKALTGALGAVLLLASLPFANATLQRRFEAQGISFFAADAEREAFERAARLMLSAYPWGVGPNHYVFIANTEGYSLRAGVNWSTGNRSANVHDSYLLIAAETGYLGLFAFLMLLFSAIWRAFATAFRFRTQPGSEILIGVGCGLVAMAVHALFEWGFVLNVTQYLFAVTLGLIAGLRSRFVRASNIDAVGLRKGARIQPTNQQLMIGPSKPLRS